MVSQLTLTEHHIHQRIKLYRESDTADLINARRGMPARRNSGTLNSLNINHYYTNVC